MGRAVFRSTSNASFLLIQLRQIGDVVLTTPIARILKERVPGCRVAFLTERPSDELLRGNPFIDEVMVLTPHAGWKETLKQALALYRRRFDVVLDFMGNPRSAFLTLLTRARLRVSYHALGRGIVYTHKVDQAGGYAVNVKKNLVRAIGIDANIDTPEIYLTASEVWWGQTTRERLLHLGPQRSSRLITVDPSHRRHTRRWPDVYYGALCSWMVERGWTPVVLWGPGEKGVAEEVVRSSQGKAVMAPPTTLRQMAALISAADLHVGNCSAPRHIAVAVGTPTFTILGATSRGWTHPAGEHADVALGLECQPCNSNLCTQGDCRCLTKLKPARVANGLAGWVSEVLGWEDEDRHRSPQGG